MDDKLLANIKTIILNDNSCDAERLLIVLKDNCNISINNFFNYVFINMKLKVPNKILNLIFNYRDDFDVLKKLNLDSLSSLNVINFYKNRAQIKNRNTSRY